ncbi:hypothetical protein Bbelb_423190 [Branchiostoma belcheri]|nr:hypothetical protein Bbelb_423190 [Branchiostoma belcheri]
MADSMFAAQPASRTGRFCIIEEEWEVLRETMAKLFRGTVPLESELFSIFNAPGVRLHHDSISDDTASTETGGDTDFLQPMAHCSPSHVCHLHNVTSQKQWISHSLTKTGVVQYV